MSGFVKWTRKSDEDWDAEVLKCVRIENKINITFVNREEGIEGRISLNVERGHQVADGKWFSNPKANEGFSVTAQGRLKEYAKQVVFEGAWYEKDGEPWDFYIEAEFT